MRVACVVVPHFMVEVERLQRPALRGRAVVVAGQFRVLSSGFRGEAARNAERRTQNSVGVLDCSSETMARGLRPGMPMREAMSRCAEAAFVEAHPERYEATTLAMVNALLELSPLVEAAESGVIYFGVGPSPQPPRPETKDSATDPMEVELAEEIGAVAGRASGLRVRIGLADGKFAAYVAAVLEGDSYCVVPPGQAAPFLADLPVRDLPVSAEMRRRLRLFGLRSLGDLAQIAKGAVAAQFGDEGARAWDLAHGIDRAPIVPYIPPKAVTERLAFAAPVDTVDALLAAVRTLLGRALHRPQVHGRAARGLRLRAYMEDGHTWEREVTFREPVGSSERMLLALRHKIEGGYAFTEVELTLLGICGESALQGNLFTVERGRQLERVAEAARQLKARYGRSILAKVIEVEPWSRIPERRFALIDYDP